MTMSGAVLIMLPIAIAACVAIILLAQRNGWLLHLGGRMATAAACYVVLLVAVPPQFAPGWQIAVLLGGLAMFATVWALGVYRYAPRPTPGATFGAFHADYQFEEVDDDEGNDWIIELVDVGGGNTGAAGGDNGGVRILAEERGAHQGGGGADGAGAGGQRQMAGPGTHSLPRQPNGDSERAGEDGARQRVYADAALANPRRRRQIGRAHV